MFFDEGQLHVQTEEGKKSLMLMKKKTQCNKSSLTKEKECCEFHKIMILLIRFLKIFSCENLVKISA